MKCNRPTPICIAILCFLLSSCGNNHSEKKDQTQIMDTARTESAIKTAEVIYTSNGQQSNGYIAYDENRKTAANPQEAMALTKPYYTHPEMSKPVVEAAIAKAATFPQADTSRVAAIGYCFGGFIVLNAAKLGAPLKGVVSFHGGLGGVQPKKGVIRGEILVCQGGADPFVPETEQAAFKKSMDSVGAHYTFVSYPGALHAFSNPNATAMGEKFKMPIAYNAAADTASWKDMRTLFSSALK